MIRPGKITAILGPPGSGKSAIAELLQFSYRPQRGNIYVGRYNSNEIDPSELRKNIFVATETTDIFTGTLAHNIAPNEDYPDLSKIMNLCVQLNVVPFIERLPSGFETKLGREIELNEQQKKIIGLLRAFYFAPEVLVFDEPTHLLELSTAILVRKMILEMKRSGTTVIILTSKLEVAAIADEIIGVDKGVVTTRSSPAAPVSEPYRT
jgi:ATP-binding cassette subfamily B protein